MCFRKSTLRILFSLCAALGLVTSPAWAKLGVLDYNVNGIGPSGSEGREALQRIVDFFDPDVLIFQEAIGTTYPQQFLAANADYEGFYSSSDGAGNRRMIMSKFDILDESVREYELGEGSLRTLFAVTLDLPGPHDLEVFTAHWNASSASVRENESATSASILQSYRLASPGSWYVYAGDFNDVDTSPRVTSLLDPSVGLTLFTPVDPNNGSSATINSDPAKGTYLDRRIDYILPSDTLLSYDLTGRVLNTWSDSAETIPSPLERSDTISASDHLPICAWFDIPVDVDPLPGDANDDGVVDGGDYTIWADNYLSTGLPPASEGGWFYGNFNEDDTVEGGDYTIWADSYNPSGASSATRASSEFAGIEATLETGRTAAASPPAVVPEPAAIAALCVGALLALRRRRR